jgi:glutaconate CoA-transferase subunit A
LTFSDVEQAKSAKHLIVTCEEIVEKDDLISEPQSNHIPSFFVDGVVEVPWGAHPCQCYNYYDLDIDYLSKLINASKNEISLSHFLKDYVFEVLNHADYLNKLGNQNLKSIMADREFGYAPEMNRKKMK